jgi:L-aminopeptidase/D-esterase-like protein
MTSLKNLLTDVPGILVGQAHDAHVASGVTVALFETTTVASAAVLGGAPAARDTECLEPDRTVAGVDAIVLSGGSGFGLDAASGAQAWLRQQDRGFAVGSVRVPIVPQAVVFDLLNGGDKQWGRYPPYRELAYEAISSAAPDYALGSAGAGYGATTADLKGGLGSASLVTPSGFTVGALAVVNAIASAVIGGGPHFWAAPFEEDEEFGGLGLPARITAAMRAHRWKHALPPSTTLALVGTDATLTKAQAKRLALAAHGGIAKALRLSYAPRDGDIVFAAATARRPLQDETAALTELCATASDCVARAIARGVFEATALPLSGAQPAWRDLFSPAASTKVPS